MDLTEQIVGKAAFAFRRTYASYRLPMMLAACSALLFAGALVFRTTGEAQLQVAKAEAIELAKRGVPPAAGMVVGAQRKVNLKEFRSSHLLAILEQGASEANIKLDEISFAIDDSPNLPYVRYRASFQVLSRYPAIRKFISEILAGSEGVVLDTVACRREDIHAAEVRCDISAYVAYREGARG